MGYGANIDRVIGSLSRVLHFRAAKQNTLRDLERYLDLSPDALFPAPPSMPQIAVTRTLLDRALRSSTLTWQSTHEVLCPNYRKRHESEYRVNRKASMRWVRPDGPRRDQCLIYVHGWLEPGSWAEETTLFRKWARELPQCDLAHVSLPFHGVRNPRSSFFSGELFWTADLVRTVEGIRQSVHDVRSAMRWLKARGYQKIGVTGLSLGGAITMLLACLDPMPDYTIPIIAHLQLVEAVEQAPILWRMRHDLESWGIDKGARREIFRRLGWADLEPVLPPERQLWIQAREDKYIDAQLAAEQHRAWGEPPILWIEGGHMTFPLHVGGMTTRIAQFIGEQ